MAVFAAAALGLAGLYCFWPSLADLWRLWTTDALRSVGMFIPPLSLWLALRRWTLADWGREGTWWGLLLVALDIYLANFRQVHALTVPIPGAGAGASLLPFGFVLFVYASGLVLLFGGLRTWRKALFALLLLLLVNPVPFWWSNLVDLPLQAIGARTARGFAEWIGVPLSGEALTLMFSPQHGIFIAPGCNGLRSVVTMGLLALVVGHLRALPLARHALFVLIAVVLAYLCNLLRLCAVVLYSAGAVRGFGVPEYGEQVDYLIGGGLFLAATAFVLWLSKRLSA